MSVLIDLITGSQRLLTRQRSHRGEAETLATGHIHFGIIEIASGHWEGITFGMHRLAGVARSATWDGLVETLVDRGQSQIVVDKLCELHHHQGIASVQVGNIRMDCSGNGSGIGQCGASYSSQSGCRDAVFILSGQQAGESGQ